MSHTSVDIKPGTFKYIESEIYIIIKIIRERLTD